MNGLRDGTHYKRQVLENMRKSLVQSMNFGARFVFYCGYQAPDFVNELTGGVSQFPSELIFNFKEWRKIENYKRIIKPEEDFDHMGNKDCFSMKPSFTIIILQDYDLNDPDCIERRQELINNIPNVLDNFDIFEVVQNQEGSYNKIEDIELEENQE
eukprot:403354565